MPLRLISIMILMGVLPVSFGSAGTVVGYVRDQNWYAQYGANPSGVGYYEFAVNGNGQNLTSVGAVAATDVFGRFSSSALAGGNYTICSWDVWWRSAYAFNVTVPVSGSSPTVDLRLAATMWGYPAFWDDAGYSEFGQTFTASGPISMIYLRLPHFTGAPSYRLTVHEGGPGGPQVGEERVFGTGDQRPIYGYGQMPTVAGRTYYARVRTSPSTIAGVIMQMDPRPDFSDPMPGGCLWVGPVGNVQPVPDRDLGLVIMSDDDGLLTEMFTRPGGATLSGATVGQTFTARGINLISAAAWLPQTPAPTYRFTVRLGGPGGTTVGTVKSGIPARVGADPEVLVTWAPGECPLIPGEVYFLEIANQSGGWVNAAMANPNNPYPFGQAFQGQAPVSGTDLACTIMEEQSAGSAMLRGVKIVSGPLISENERQTNSVTIRWATDLLSDSKVEFALDTPPYTRTEYDPRLVSNHAVTLRGLKPNAMYHYRVSSAAANSRAVVSRDLVICTKASQPNLLLNPGFEEGTGTGASRPLVNWVSGGGVDIKEANGTWFWGMPPHSGNWLLQGAVNGNSSDGFIYQRVSAASGKLYTFSAWATTWMRENDTWKYDVWHERSRLIYMRLGIDPYGGTNPQSPNIQWTPRFYSHRRYSNLAKTAVAQSSFMTVFVSMKGDGGQWHLYGLDDCVLTETAVSQPYWSEGRVQPDGSFSARIVGDPGTVNTIQVSTNLVDWSDLAQVAQTNAVVPFVDPGALQGQVRYYRAKTQ